MKKCPYCAEEIQDEAIVCRYCGRDLHQSISPMDPSTTSQTPSQQPQSPIAKAKRSVWATGAIWGAVLTVIGASSLYVSGHIIDIPSITIEIISDFIVLWLFFTLVTWLWRKTGSSGWGKAAIVIGIIVIIVILNILEYTIDNPSPLNTEFFPTVTQYQLPTNLPTSIPTSLPTRYIPEPSPKATEASCILWSLVNKTYIGQIVCVYGIVNEVAPYKDPYGDVDTYLFLRPVNTGPLVIVVTGWGEYPDIHQMDCMEATGPISLNITRLEMIVNKIYHCPAGLNP